MSWFGKIPALFKRPVEPAYMSLFGADFDGASVYDAPEVFLRDFQRIAEKQRNLMAAHLAHSEVQNGGFTQFFLNSTGVLAPEARAAFAALGMVEAADLVGKAMEVFQDPYPRLQEDRLGAMGLNGKASPAVGSSKQVAEAMEQALQSLSERYWALERRPGLGFVEHANRYVAEKNGDG